MQYRALDLATRTLKKFGALPVRADLASDALDFTLTAHSLHLFLATHRWLVDSVSLDVFLTSVSSTFVLFRGLVY